jgi:hypothetical protein
MADANNDATQKLAGYFEIGLRLACVLAARLRDT